MNIRKATPGDARAIHEMHMNSIRTNCRDHYSSREIAAWSGRKFDEAHRIRTIEEDLVLVLVENDRILGFTHFSKDGELKALYLDESAIGQGFGRQLLREVEKEANRHDLPRIFLSSTLNAIGFYKHCGFAPTGPSHTVEINCEEVGCVPMEKIMEIKI